MYAWFMLKCCPDSWILHHRSLLVYSCVIKNAFYSVNSPALPVYKPDLSIQATTRFKLLPMHIHLIYN
jgi:hypothetical protein